MKKLFGILFVAMMIVVLVACGGTQDELTAEPTPTVTETPTPPEPTLEPEPTPMPTPESIEIAPPLTNDLEIVEFGYSIVTRSNRLSLHYAIFLYNPNEHAMVRFPSYRITASSEDGRVLGTDRSVRGYLNPNGLLVFAGRAFDVDEHPASVEIEVEPIEDRNWMPHFELYEPLEVEGAHENTRGRILGQIINPNDRSFDRVIIVAIYRDESGALLGGEITFERNLPAFGMVAFEIRGRDFDGAHSFEVYAFPD